MKFKKAIYPGYLGRISQNLDRSFKELPEPLKWYEPSINMPFLEACSNYIFMNYYSSCQIIGLLLEHSLKMAMIDTINNGQYRRIDENIKKKYYTMGQILESKDEKLKAQMKYLLEKEENINWWLKTAKPFRNAFSHMDITQIFELFASEAYQGEYTIEAELGTNPKQWGHLWHRFAENLALKMLKETKKQLTILFDNTEWIDDSSEWEIQKKEYYSFFNKEGIEYLI